MENSFCMGVFKNQPVLRGIDTTTQSGGVFSIELYNSIEKQYQNEKIPRASSEKKMKFWEF